MKYLKFNIIGKRGFSLTEILVSTGVFTVVITIALGAFVKTNDVFHKTRALQSEIDTLTVTLDSMAKNIRTGIRYHCDVDVGNINLSRDCPEGANSFYFLSSQDGLIGYELDTLTDKIVYVPSAAGESISPITTEGVSIENLAFYVSGAEVVSDQPRVTITLGGFIKGKEATADTRFDIQTTISQRLLQ